MVVSGNKLYFAFFLIFIYLWKVSHTLDFLEIYWLLMLKRKHLLTYGIVLGLLDISLFIIFFGSYFRIEAG